MTIHDADKELRAISLISRCDPSANELIYRTYAGYLTGVCSRYLSDPDDIKDVLQDSFIKIFSTVNHSFSYRGPGSLKAWLTKVTVNETLKFIKREYKPQFISLATDEMDIADIEPDIEQIPLTLIHEMIRELPPGYRTVFNLFVFENKSHKEIASLLNIKENTSASQFHRAKAMLAEKIRKYQNSTESTAYER